MCVLFVQMRHSDIVYGWRMSKYKHRSTTGDSLVEGQSENRSKTIISTICLDTRQSQELGFTLRGGLEYGIGIYVSHVNPGSQAELKGLLKGDRILRINGHNLKYALQKEALTLILSRRDATLVVKHSGKLPYFDDETSQLVWKEVGVKSSGDNSVVYREGGTGKKYHRLPDSGSKLPPALVDCSGAEELSEATDRNTSSRLPMEGIRTRFGMLVESVTGGSVFSKVGIEEGDEITELNGIPLEGLSILQMNSMMAAMPITTLKTRKCDGRELVVISDRYRQQERSSLFTPKSAEFHKVKGNRQLYKEKHEEETLFEKSCQNSNEKKRCKLLGKTLPSIGDVTDRSIPHNLDTTSSTHAYKTNAHSQEHIPKKFGKESAYRFGEKDYKTTKSMPTTPKLSVPSSSYLGQKPVLLQNHREKPQLSPIAESQDFTNSQVNGRTLKIIRISKSGGDVGIELMGGIGSMYQGRIIVSSVTRYGIVGRHGEIKVGDQIMMVNGCKMVDTTVGEAMKLLFKAMADHKDYLEFIVPARRDPQFYPQNVV